MLHHGDKVRVEFEGVVSSHPAPESEVVSVDIDSKRVNYIPIEFVTRVKAKAEDYAVGVVLRRGNGARVVKVRRDWWVFISDVYSAPIRFHDEEIDELECTVAD